ncbi:uncharacterized protein [Nicotiana tomentosiformis]|uniref:uncharacterized protein n=1 Tax=Nicotiana tomentosiformis TaxID=4098 RepID=UPI00388CDEFC
MEGVAKNGTFPVAPAVSQAWGGAQTPTTPAPEQITPQYQAPAAPPVGVVQPIVVAQAGDRTTTSSETLLRLDSLLSSFQFNSVVHLLRIHMIILTAAMRVFKVVTQVDRDSFRVSSHNSRGPVILVVIEAPGSSQQQGSHAMVPPPVASPPTQPARDFDVILDIDWLSPYHTILDCHAKTMTLTMLGLPRPEWKRTLGHSMDSVPVVCEFSDVFPADLMGMPPDRDIDFCIDLALGTQPISIPPYRKAQSELKELKELLQDLLD